MSIVHMGKPGTNLGKHFTVRTKKRMSIALKGNQNFKGKHHTDETKKKMSVAKSFPLGSKRFNHDGYVLVKTYNGWKLEHRLVMEKKLSRKLASNEIPHHKNRVRNDNRLKNLKLMSKIKHDRLRHDTIRNI